LIVPAYVSFLFLVLLLAHFPFGIPFVQDIQCGFRGITEREAHSKRPWPAGHRTHAPSHEEQTHDDAKTHHHEGEYPPEIKTIKPRTEHVYHLLSDYIDGGREEKDTELSRTSLDLPLIPPLLHDVKPPDSLPAWVIWVKRGFRQKILPLFNWLRMICLSMRFGISCASRVSGGKSDMKKIVVLRGPSKGTVEEKLMTECLKILFPGCEIQVSVASSGVGLLTQSESPM
jgi:hypothetical protein